LRFDLVGLILCGDEIFELFDAFDIILIGEMILGAFL
jgi:hypothetical protein